MKTPKDILIEARALISDPKRWTQGSWAKNARGWDVFYNDPSAVCFCASSALRRSCNLLELETAWGILAREMDGGVAPFNDSHTHAEVMDAFQKAIDSLP